MTRLWSPPSLQERDSRTADVTWNDRMSYVTEDGWTTDVTQDDRTTDVTERGRRADVTKDGRTIDVTRDDKTTYITEVGRMHQRLVGSVIGMGGRATN